MVATIVLVIIVFALTTPENFVMPVLMFSNPKFQVADEASTVIEPVLAIETFPGQTSIFEGPDWMDALSRPVTVASRPASIEIEPEARIVTFTGSPASVGSPDI